ncbi:OmpP1/FadL family transporter [Leptospira wolffii]|uniref:OmpP1/FadL family transporter n=1 Tax=Leptospira wolffii TaxID=409998 RepID=A0ABV5BSX9_9LEPT
MLKPSIRALIFIPLLSIVEPVRAFQGILQPAFGARQAGMGGAFQAVGGSVMDLESNPSHLSRLKNAKWELGAGFHSPRIEYKDKYISGDPNEAYENRLVESPKAILPYLGYITPLNDRVGIGFALYSQGGGGGMFSNIRRLSPNGKTLDETLGTDLPYIGNERRILENLVYKFITVKFTSGVGMKFGNLSLGAGLDLVYAFMELQKTYRDPTGSLELPGSLRYNSDPSYSYGGKLGMSYDLSDTVRIAYSYTTRNLLPLDGSMRVLESDGTAQASRVSRYMVWPDKHIMGISYRKESWILDFDIKFIPWSRSFRSSKFVLDHSSVTTPFGTDSNVMQMNFHWKDQWVFSLGGEYKWNENFRTRMGYSYGKTPTGERGVSPMLGTTTEHHLAAGFGWYMKEYAFHFAVEYGFPKSVSGAKNSDWTLAHSVFPNSDVEVQRFDHSKSMSIVSLYLGMEKNI